MNKPVLRQAPAGLPYRLDDHVGFMLRQVVQRHTAIFAAGVDGEITTTQWAALSKLNEMGPLSQNLLGRLTVMDAATIKGVVDRLTHRGLTRTGLDPDDARRRLVSLTAEGDALVARVIPKAHDITMETLAPLAADERDTLIALLLKLR